MDGYRNACAEAAGGHQGRVCQRASRGEPWGAARPELHAGVSVSSVPWQLFSTFQ